jgi:hypothetical protein
MKPMLKAPGTERLELKLDNLLSNVALNPVSDPYKGLKALL